MPQQKYIKPFKIPLKSRAGGGETLSYLLWGDPVQVKDSNPPNAEWVEVMARFWDSGFVKSSDLMVDPILEIYIIDVGQGDGVLFKTPDNKWHLLDAGTTNSRQMTRKGAANFVRFKFIQDLRREKVQLENLILSHPDLDHYGGMIDLLKGDLHGHDRFETEVVNFYHNGLGRFRQSPKLGTEVSDGVIADFPIRTYNLNKRPTFITQLLNGKADFQSNRDRFIPEYQELADLLIQKAGNIARISADTRFLPGYEQDNPSLKIRVLGPIIEPFNNNRIGLRKLGSEAKTVNGHSIVLRIDFDQVKILLTGDLNEESQKLLLNYIPKEEFAVDIAKGCHHGSEDVLFEFLKHMKPKATIISSGDNESYSHPQPQILGASAYYGSEYKGKDGKQYPPLVYSTELARSTELKFPGSVKTRSQPGANDYVTHDAFNTLIQAQGESGYRTLLHVPINTDLIYGLVSVRTDGRTVLIATSEEQGRDFDTKVLRFD
ncbi:MAG: MBL fold metallo-hydrolase [Haliscomenobacter sp.]|uniref:ComEC/Rec2 family competence protein n=1 Tax=Haliscomenobacter sp. TaxID=2717303 RepID=UPI0029BF7270|nr:MBL fold metallo-hydrolase [Haliscomenobacter sp.]MDX2070796.1 MBL fold metallo-hydrolase [Haliscomenobacter sp.]